MNSLTTTSNPFDPTLRMSSLEISELMEKNHQHVMRDIRNLIDQEAINASRSGLVEYKDAKGEMRPMYELDFQATMVLITGYDANRRALVIDRWVKLETGEAEPSLDFNRQVMNDPTIDNIIGALSNTITTVNKLVASVERLSQPVPSFYVEKEELYKENIRLLNKQIEFLVEHPSKRRNFTKEEDLMVIELRSQGLSHRQIGLRIGRNPDSISSCLRRLGVQ